MSPIRAQFRFLQIQEALAASSASKGPRMEKGNLLQSYNVKYLGTVNVSLPKGDDVAAEAMSRIVRLEPTEKVRVCLSSCVPFSLILDPFL